MYTCNVQKIFGGRFMRMSNEKSIKKEEEYVFTALTKSEIKHLQESMHHNHQLMVRLAQL